MLTLHLEPETCSSHLRRLLESRLQVAYFAAGEKEKLLEVAKGQPFEALFVRLGVSVDSELLEALPHLRYVVTPTTGLTHLDQDALIQRNIRLISLQGETEFLQTVTSTAEHAWGLLLTLCRNTCVAVRDVNDGHWRRTPFLGTELRGKTLGIMGLGRLGLWIKRYGEAFQMRVLGWDKDPEVRYRHNISTESLEEFLKQSDVVSLHTSYSSEDKHLFDNARFAQMKRGALFVNTARGEFINEEDLVESLETGRLSGAALDVMGDDSGWPQAVPKNHPLVRYAGSHSNLLITPHIGGYTREAIHRTREFIIQKLFRIMEEAF